MLTFCWVKGEIDPGTGDARIIAASGVSAVELLEEGKIKVTWTTPFQDADYAVTSLAGSSQPGYLTCFDESNPQTPADCSFQFFDSKGAFKDPSVFHIIACGGQAGT